MGETVKTFDAVVLAGLAAVLGIGLVVGAMLALLSGGKTMSLVLANSIPVGTIVGVLLLLTAGAFGTEQRWARYLGLVAFLAVVIFGFPSLSEPSVFPIAQAVVSALATVYLLFRNPVSRPDRSAVDESRSATKVGSTIR